MNNTARSGIIIFWSIFSFIHSGCVQNNDEKPDMVSLANLIEEATIAQIHESFKNGELTSEKLTGYYLEKIARFDQSSRLNAIILINPDAIKIARELDEEFKNTGKLRPLHGIPVVVKDNFDTEGIQTTGGSLALKGSIPPDDSYQVRKLKEAGAIVLCKSNMAEWAFSAEVTESSIAGITRNPYNLDHVPAGSSGGTAAAVASNFGMIGLGSDTGNSIRGPSSHACLVGIRSTMGLTSRDGIIPLYLRNDIGGPMCRTVEDAVRVFEVIAGYDPADPITKLSEGKVPENYTQFLQTENLKGVRIGVFRQLSNKEGADPEVVELFNKALQDLKALGAEVVEGINIPGFYNYEDEVWCNTIEHDVNIYLASLGENAPYKTFEDIYKSGLYLPYIKERIERGIGYDNIDPVDREDPCEDVYTDPSNVAFTKVVLAMMDEHNLDAIIYPSWSNPARLVGDMESPDGNNCYQIPPPTGMPSITVPMGFVSHNLPAGLQFTGRHFSEPELIRFVYAYEQATKHRRPPEIFNLNRGVHGK